MTMVRFNPWRDFHPALSAVQPASDDAGWTPPVDVWESAEDYRIELEIPAVRAADVDVAIDDGVLKISGVRKRPSLDDSEQNRRQERRYGAFQRLFQLPEQADPDSVEARVAEGVLEVRIAKQATMQPRRIEVVAA